MIDIAIRRREAGAFLRSRRERLAPSDVGLPLGSRRRTPGLRREEVAMLAGVGSTWYTWLEQGRDVQPSQDVLLALAAALRLDSVEQQHLLVLHGRTAPDGPSEATEQVSEAVRRMLDSLTGQPAYVLGRRWDVLAWNKAADAVYGPYQALSGEERNALHQMFANPAYRRLLVDWEAVARASLAMFRADFARHSSDPAFQGLVRRLEEASPEFARWWPRREVAHPLSGVKRLLHPHAGPMHFEYSSFGVGQSPDMKLIVFTPSADHDTSGKLARLLSHHPRSK